MGKRMAHINSNKGRRQRGNLKAAAGGGGAMKKTGKKAGPSLPSRLWKELGQAKGKAAASASAEEEEAEEAGEDFYEYEEGVPEEMSGKNRRYDDVDQLEYELPSDFEDEEIDENAAYGGDGNDDDLQSVGKENIDVTSEEEEISDAELAAEKEGDEFDEEIEAFNRSEKALLLRKVVEDEMDPEEDDEEQDESDDDVRHERMVTAVTGKPVKNKRESKRRKDYVISEAYPESEYNVGPSVARTNSAASLQGITVADLMASLQGMAGYGALKKKMRGRVQPKAPVEVPLPRVIQEKIERKAGYEKTTEEVSKWLPIIKENREASTLIFNQRTSYLTPSTAALAANFKPTTDLEKEIASLLQENHLNDAKEIEASESLELNKLTVEEVRQRQERLSKMRSLLFQHEAKAKRIKKIKSKTFHRLLKRSDKYKAGVNMFETDPEAKKDEVLKQEYKRAQERMTLKHKNTSRWAKRILERGLKMHTDDGTRDAIAEQLRIHAELTRKLNTAKRSSSDDDSDSEDEDNADARNEGNGLVLGKKSGSKILAKAKMETLKLLEGDGEAEIPNSGLFALPFMARAIEKKRKVAQSEAMAVLDQLKQVEADGLPSSNDGERNGGGMKAGEATGLLSFGERKSANAFLRTGSSERGKADDLVEDHSDSEDDTFEHDSQVKRGPIQVLHVEENHGKTVDISELPTKTMPGMGDAEAESHGLAFMTMGHVTETIAPVSVDLVGHETRNPSCKGSPIISQPVTDASIGHLEGLSDEYKSEVFKKSAAGINPVLFGDIDKKVNGTDISKELVAPRATNAVETVKKKKKSRTKKKTEGLNVNEVPGSDSLKQPVVAVPVSVSIAGNPKKVQRSNGILDKDAGTCVTSEVHSGSFTGSAPPTRSYLQHSDESDDDGFGEQGTQLLDGIGSQEDIVRRAFAGDNVEAEFEEAKLQALDVEVPLAPGAISLPGWGQWTSIQQKHGPPSWILKEQENQKKSREAALSKRKDAKLKHAIISEKLDRKAVKFMSSSLPFPYKSREVFERNLRMPIGREYNTDEAFRNMIRPAEIKSAGVLIEPIKYEKPKANGKHLESRSHMQKPQQKRRVSLEVSAPKRSKRSK